MTRHPPRPAPPSDEQVVAYFSELSNWGRWGANDELGTLNLITAAKCVEAAQLVRSGRTVGCARPILREEGAADVFHQPLHHMLATGEDPTSLSAADFYGIAPHGLTVSHVDALSHSFWDGRMYNGRASAEVTASGARRCSVEVMKDGIVTRGVLLDIAALHDRPFLDPGEPIFTSDLDLAERRLGVHVGPGDALLIRTGWYARRGELGAPPDPRHAPGLHAETLPWLRERDVAVIAADAAHDVIPSGYSIRRPIHKVGMVAMGLCLIDACQFEDLAAWCASIGRWEFMFVVAPLRWRNGTVSPITPLAVF